MKIGILTFHCAHNYGAVLQCYALQKVLQDMGHNVEVINYTPTYLTNLYKWFFWRRFVSKQPKLFIKKTISEIKILKKRIERYHAFNQFIHKYIHLSHKYANSKKISSNYDIYIIGSDQVWNSSITRGFDSAYFGFYPFKKGKRIYVSYAASMGKTDLNQKEIEYLKCALKNFNGISVREETIQKYLQELTTKEIQTVLDPTLLLQPKQWEKMAIKPNLSEQYVLVYQVRQDDNTIRIANKIAKQLNCKVIEISAHIHPTKNSKCFETCSPEEFLGLIKYSTFIVSTSFHGTVFSILFKKDFVCIKLNDGKDNRSASLLEIFNLSSRMISKESSPEFSKINYESIDYRKYHIMLENSLRFLKKNIEPEMNDYQ